MAIPPRTQIVELQEICERHALPMVEDAAESLGSFYRGKHTGTFGRLGVLSFNGNKVVTTGGGAIPTDDEALPDRAKHLTTTARCADRWRFRHDEVGYNYRLPNLNAALGCAQMETLPAMLAAKRTLAEGYCAAFADVGGMRFFAEPPDCRSNYWLNSLVLEESRAPARRTAGRDGLIADIDSIDFPAYDLLHPVAHAPHSQQRAPHAGAVGSRLHLQVQLLLPHGQGVPPALDR